MLTKLFNRMADHATLSRALDDASTFSKAAKVLDQAATRMAKGLFSTENTEHEQGYMLESVKTALHYRDQATTHEQTFMMDHALCNYLAQSAKAGFNLSETQVSNFYAKICMDAEKSRTYTQHAEYLKIATRLNTAIQYTGKPEMYHNTFISRMSNDVFHVLENIKDYSRERDMISAVTSFHHSAHANGYMFELHKLKSYSNYYHKSSKGDNAGGLASSLSKAASMFDFMHQENQQKLIEQANKNLEQTATVTAPKAKAPAKAPKKKKTTGPKKLKR